MKPALYCFKSNKLCEFRGSPCCPLGHMEFPPKYPKCKEHAKKTQLEHIKIITRSRRDRSEVKK